MKKSSQWVTIGKAKESLIGQTIANERRGIRPTRVTGYINGHGIVLDKEKPEYGDLIITENVRVRIVKPSTRR